jgi:hypothetical protein
MTFREYLQRPKESNTGLQLLSQRNDAPEDDQSFVTFLLLHKPGTEIKDAFCQYRKAVRMKSRPQDGRQESSFFEGQPQ